MAPLEGLAEAVKDSRQGEALNAPILAIIMRYILIISLLISSGCATALSDKRSEYIRCLDKHDRKSHKCNERLLAYKAVQDNMIRDNDFYIRVHAALFLLSFISSIMAASRAASMY